VSNVPSPVKKSKLQKIKIPVSDYRDFQDLKFTIPRQPIMKNRPGPKIGFFSTRLTKSETFFVLTTSGIFSGKYLINSTMD
jgi:hypothetical protein